MILPGAGRGRPRKRHSPDRLSGAAGTLLASQPGRAVTWRRGAKGRLAARFAALRVRVADGPPRRLPGRGAQRLPGEEVWGVGESRAAGERKPSLANLPGDTDPGTLASIIKARWASAQAHPPRKGELGLDHLEGRPWTGPRRQALMTMVALAFLQHRRPKPAGRGKERSRATAPAEPARDPAGDLAAALRPLHPPTRCPHRRRWIRPPEAEVPKEC